MFKAILDNKWSPFLNKLSLIRKLLMGYVKGFHLRRDVSNYGEARCLANVRVVREVRLFLTT
jgi:hypothetical protein